MTKTRNQIFSIAITTGRVRSFTTYKKSTTDICTSRLKYIMANDLSEEQETVVEKK